MLPARGPRPRLKGETDLSLRLMDDVQVPQIAQRSGRELHPTSRPQSESLRGSVGKMPQMGGEGFLRCPQVPCERQTFGPEWHFFGPPQRELLRHPVPEVPEPVIRDFPSVYRPSIRMFIGNLAPTPRVRSARRSARNNNDT